GTQADAPPRHRGVPPDARECAPGPGAQPREPAPRRREHLPQGDRGAGRDRRREHRDPRRAGAGRARGAVAHHRPDRGRDRHRQGAGRARHPRRQRPAGPPLRGGQPRVPLGGPPRERTLRTPAPRLPPLRDRREDIPVLARHLTRRLAAQLKKPVGEPTDETLALLARYAFPGNVRELANELERAVLLAEPGAPLTEDLLSERVQEGTADGAPPGLLQSRTEAFEREQVEAALARAGGVKTRAAEELGITYRGLLKKMRRLGM